MVCGKPGFLVTFVLLSVTAMPLCVQARTVQEAVSQALTDHPSITGARAGYDAAVQEVRMQKSSYYPEVSASIAGGRVYQDNATSRGLDVTRGAAYSGYGEGTVSLRQMLFDGFETSGRVGAAKDRAQSLDASENDMEEQIALRTVQSYLNLLRTQEALNHLETQKGRIADYGERIRGMVDEGAADEAELQQARDVLMLIDSGIADYDGQVAAARAAYQEVVGTAPEGIYDKPDSLSAVILSDVEEAVALARSEHPALQAARHEIGAAENEVRAARAAYLPDISSEVSYNKIDKKDVIGGEALDKRALLRVNWGFSTGGKQISSVNSKQKETEKAQARYDELQRGIERDIRQAYAQYETYRRKLALSDERIDLNEKLFATYQSQFEGARINLLTLMRAESQLFNARLERIDNEYNLLSAEYMILASTGRLRDTILSENVLEDHAQGGEQ